MSKKKVMEKSHCSGCNNNFYNGNNNMGIAECWNLKTAKLRERYQIPSNMPIYQENFIEVEKPSCYTKQGYFFSNDISGYMKRPKNDN